MLTGTGMFVASARSTRRRSKSFSASRTETGGISSASSCRSTSSPGRSSRPSGDSIDDPRTGGPIGDGPFLVGTWDRGKQLTLVRNPHYWGSHTAYLNRLVYRFLPIEDLASALRRGEIDMIDPGPAQLQAAALEFRRTPEPGIRVLTSAEAPMNRSRSGSVVPVISRSRSRSSGKRWPTGSTASRSHAASERCLSTTGRRSSHRTMCSSSRTAPTTGRTGRGTGTGQLGLGSCSNRPVAAGGPTASSSVAAIGSHSLWVRSRASRGGRGRSSSSKLSFAGSGSRYDQGFRRSTSGSNKYSRTETSTSPSFRGTRQIRPDGRTSSAAGAIKPHRLLQSARHPRPRPGHAHDRRSPARAAPEQSRRTTGEGGAVDPPVPGQGPLRPQSKRPRRRSEWRGLVDLERGGLVARSLA